MKRFVFAVSMIISFLIFNCMVAFADALVPSYQEFDDYAYPITGFHCAEISYNAFYSNVSQHDQWGIYIGSLGSSRRYYFYYGEGVTENNGVVTLTNCYYNNNEDGNVSAYGGSLNWTLTASDMYFANFDDFQSNFETVDWDNPSYSPLIPTPQFSVNMSMNNPWELPTDETNYFDITMSDYAGYYVQVGYRYYCPNAIKIGLMDGKVTYNPITYYNSDYEDLYSLQDTVAASSANIISSLSNFEWDKPIMNYLVEDQWSTSVPVWANNFSNSAYVLARKNWVDHYSNMMPLYGNKIEIFVRLFVIQDNAVYVGAWRHWVNTYPNEYSEEIPEDYQTGNPLPGIVATSNDKNLIDQTNTKPIIGESTGNDNSSVVINNNLTPNYPDYPTVATYNHDNILLQFINTAKNLPSFFTEFASFLTVSFAFIPAEIWSIIGFGFLASIVIMIVKIL